MDGRSLVGHVFKKIEIPSRDVCEVNCFVEADCVSFNVVTLAEGKHRCELSNSDHRVHPEDLVYGAGMIYTPVTVRVTSYHVINSMNGELKKIRINVIATSFARACS